MLLDKNELFILMVDDMRKKIKTGTAYEILKACGLFRQLIADKTCLLKEINRDLHYKAKFVVPDVTGNILLDVRSPIGHIAWVTVDPDGPLFEKTKEVDWKKFLEIPVLRFNRRVFTIDNVVCVAANYYGGIHYKKPHSKDKLANSYIALEAAIETNEKVTLLAIKAICKVTIKALEPIVEILETHKG
jgi:hypothetical protein